MEISERQLIEKLHGLFKTNGKRLSVAESSTAGLISHMITSLPGSSAFFDSSVVCYSMESKKRFLGISDSLVKSFGVISEEAARAMAEAVRKKTGTDFGLAITGNLGPAALEGKKVGILYIAVSFEGGTESRGMMYEGPREEVKNSAALAALKILYEVASVWS